MYLSAVTVQATILVKISNADYPENASPSLVFSNLPTQI